jgi:hypothetical protein
MNEATRTVLEARYPHHHRGAQQDAADDLGDDTGLVQQPQRIWSGQIDQPDPPFLRLLLVSQPLTVQKLAKKNHDDCLRVGCYC